MAPIRTPSRPSSPSPPASLTDSPSHSSSLTLELPRSTTDNELALSDGASSDGEGSTASSSKRAKGKGMHRRRSSAHRVRETLNAKSISLDDGKRTVNQYRLGPEIGKGAFGRVELGVDVQTGITYAVKEYSKSRLRRQVHQRSMANARLNRGRPRRGGKDATIDVTSTSEGKDRNRVEEGNPLALIAREMAIMKKLDHPNLIHLYEVLDVPDEDSLFMVLEYCSGGILMELPPLHPPSNPSSSASEASTSSSAFPTPVRPPMSLLSAKRYFSQILMGLEYLHENDVVHLDLKPENILLGADGKTAKLCDFGVSEMFKQRGDDRVRKGMGSPAFQSPESLGEGREIHAKAADVWALGITLYCMRSGFLPFRYDNPLDLFEAIKHERILFPPHFTGAGRDIIERLLERDPEKRITIDEIRVHPWLSDIDMPSKEENLAEERMVDEPSQSEINDAIRSISSAFAVIRAVQKFKKLGAQGSANRASRSEIPSRQSTLDSSAVSMTSESPPITRPSTPSSSFSARHPSPTATSSFHLAGREDAARKSSEDDLDGKGKPKEEGQIGEDITAEPEEYSEDPMEISDEPVDLSDEPLEITDEPFEISDEPESIEELPTLASQPPSFYPARSVSRRPRPPSPSSSLSPDQIVRPSLHATLSPPSSFSRSDHPARTSSSSSSSSLISSPPGSARPDRPRLNLEVTDHGSTGGGKGERTPEAEGGDANALGAGLSSKFGMIVVESPGGGRSELG